MYSLNDMIKRLLKYARPYRFTLIIAFLSTVVVICATLLCPYIIGAYIIPLFKEGFNVSQLLVPSLCLVLIIIVGTIFGFIQSWLLNLCTYRIIKDIQIDAFNKLLTLPVSYLDSHYHGEILTRVTSDVDRTWDGLLHGFTHIFRGAVQIVFTIVLMFIIKWEMALVVVLLTPLSLLASGLIAKLSHKSYKEQASINGHMGGLINEMISDQKTVISYNLMDENNKKYQSFDKDLYKVGVKAQFVASFANPSTRLANAIVYAAVAIAGTIFIVKSSSGAEISVATGILFTFLTYTSQYTKPFNEVASVAAELSNSFASYKRVLELIDTKDMDDESKKVNKIINNNEFKLNQVRFSYLLGKEIIKGISFDVLKNKKVAIVGPTGCGKTTLINLLMRYYDIDSGSIKLDQEELNNYQREYIRKYIGMVLQDTWLFKGSVKDNIKYGREDASDDEVLTAAISVHAHDFISKLPNSYDTIIDDDEGLSVGQKQLICIARLMLTEPNILILDEATSNIDTRTEVNVQKAFNYLMEGRTSIVIAHRLSTIRNADLIIVMKDGKIIEHGNHKQLIKHNGFYKELYNSL